MAYSGLEAARINATARPLGIDMTRQVGGTDASGELIPSDRACPALTDCGKCAVYAVRPMICRVWGLVRELACPHGCLPERWMSGRETKAFLALVNDGELHGPGRDFVRAMHADPDLRDKVHADAGNPFGPKGSRSFK